MMFIFLKRILKLILIFYFVFLIVGNFSNFKNINKFEFNPNKIISNFFDPSSIEDIQIKTNVNKLLYVKHLSFSGNFININYDKFIFQIFNKFNDSRNFKININYCKNSNNLNSKKYLVNFSFNNLFVKNNTYKNFKFNIDDSLKSLIKYDFNKCNFELISNNSIIYSFDKKLYFKK